MTEKAKQARCVEESTEGLRELGEGEMLNSSSVTRRHQLHHMYKCQPSNMYHSACSSHNGLYVTTFSRGVFKPCVFVLPQWKSQTRLSNGPNLRPPCWNRKIKAYIREACVCIGYLYLTKPCDYTRLQSADMPTTATRSDHCWLVGSPRTNWQSPRHHSGWEGHKEACIPFSTSCYWPALTKSLPKAADGHNSPDWLYISEGQNQSYEDWLSFPLLVLDLSGFL